MNRELNVFDDRYDMNDNKNIVVEQIKLKCLCNNDLDFFCNQCDIFQCSKCSLQHILDTKHNKKIFVANIKELNNLQHLKQLSN
jgi:hypothetical protein